MTESMQDRMHPYDLRMLKGVVKAILEHPEGYEWSIQGLGMLRTYLTKALRMHIWSPKHAFPDVSTMHDHPWDFRSLVVSGGLVNTRYVPSKSGDVWMTKTIVCGPGGCAVDEPKPIKLFECLPETYFPGEHYMQLAHEIHKTVPAPGTVTILDRTFKPDTEHARVFWKPGGDWVSAEPRKATPQEVTEITQAALPVLKCTLT